MNLKKIGLTALAGSLVATSVYAGELAVSGSASMKVVHVNGGAANTGKTIQELQKTQLRLSQWETNLHLLVQVN